MTVADMITPNGRGEHTNIGLISLHPGVSIYLTPCGVSQKALFNAGNLTPGLNSLTHNQTSCHSAAATVAYATLK